MYLKVTLRDHTFRDFSHQIPAFKKLLQHALWSKRFCSCMFASQINIYVAMKLPRIDEIKHSTLDKSVVLYSTYYVIKSDETGFP